MTRRRPLLALFAADIVSMTGNVITLVAIPWFVLQTTGSPAKTGLVSAFHFLPIVVANFFGGTLVDRVGFKTMSVISDLASAASVAAIPALHMTVGLPFGALIALVFLGALLDSPGATARRALLPDASTQAGWPFERSTGVAAAIERGSRMAGGPIAGVLIATVGAANLLWVDAATFLFSAVVTGVIVPNTMHGRREERATYFAELKEGLRFLRSSSLLLAIVVTVCITNLLDSSIGVLMPIYADEVYSSALMLGIGTGALGAGSVAGALLYAVLGRGLSRFRVFAACFVVVSLEFFVLALFPPPAVMATGVFIAGLAAGPLNPIIDTVSFEQIPASMRGRVFGVVHSAAWMSIPIGVLAAGVIVESIGLRPTLLITGIAYVAVTGSIWVNPAMRGMDAQPSPERLAA
jgi:MFS family permease